MLTAGSMQNPHAKPATLSGSFTKRGEPRAARIIRRRLLPVTETSSGPRSRLSLRSGVSAQFDRTRLCAESEPCPRGRRVQLAFTYTTSVRSNTAAAVSL